ncbi:MAG: hypothetical protein Q8Q31_05815 [Nanoarchaeota archaeon]|nr:hypothetical protein [Nanoarchaeota archaeon]
MVRVRFYSDAEKELRYLRLYVKMCGKSKLTDSALRFLELEDEIAKNELARDYENKDFKSFVNNIKKSWGEIESKYFKRIVEITDYNWNTEEYECVLADNVPGFAVIPEKKVIVIGRKIRKDDVSISLPLESQLYVLAHELFHLHYFEVVRREDLPMEAIKMEMTETIPVIVFFYDSELPKFWPSVSLEKAKGSYNEVQDNFDSALELWNSKKNYIGFLRSFVSKLRSNNSKEHIKKR